MNVKEYQNYLDCAAKELGENSTELDVKTYAILKRIEENDTETKKLLDEIKVLAKFGSMF